MRSSVVTFDWFTAFLCVSYVLIHSRCIQAQTVVASQCFEGALFTLVDANLKFEQSEEFCIENSFGTLARISSRQEYDFILDLVGTSSLDSNFWIGNEMTPMMMYLLIEYLL